MRFNSGRTAIAVLALLALSCASPEKLTRQSEEALARGQGQEAYEKARKALDKEPQNERARQAMATAAARLMSGWKDGILGLAASDTLAAARRCRELDAFRRELSDYHVGLLPDTVFSRQEDQIRSSAAGVYYQRGVQALGARQARVAYDAFLAARDLFPAYRDVESLIREALAKAVEHVAILPFANQTDVRGLSMEMADRVYSEVTRRITTRDFRFTVVMNRDQVYARVPVAGLSRMTREDAVRIGRQLGADCVIYGRFFGLTARTNSDTWHQTVVRREVTRDGKGGTSERYVEDPVDVVRRTREVSIQYEFEVLDTETGAPLGSGSDVLRSEARTLYTDFTPRENTDDYLLYQPDLRKREPDRAKALDKGWKDHVGSWSVPEFMEHARKAKDRAAYRPAYRSEFFGHTRDHPVFLGDLPPEGDLALIALDDLWRPVLSALKDLEKAP
jgi:hypothetical protein